MDRLKTAIKEYTFSTSRNYLDQVNELAQQKQIDLTWGESRNGPNHDVVWQAWPIVAGKAYPDYNRAGKNIQEAKRNSAQEMISIQGTETK
ncbi:hypothetical protein SISSUDRAFT_1061966 [Sistotremastrum suecicum HHB10207 ss-3]|uniref:DRBM domain-containing protein n=1 Tax=Sistotremastrum suecicum HHB10207 ss-3 TaxID=1314776 RepID=A0A166DGX6_9AGAM|nr:hypothetical protein SISSUDRAFT_1061966 [Sistotremastrum suecicum HHB10207 ss-3]